MVCRLWASMFALSMLWTLGVPTAIAAEGSSSSSGSVGKPEVDEEARGLLAKPRIGLEDLFRLAELGNPDLAAARSETVAAGGRARQAGLYPNPTFGYDIEDAPTDDFASRTDKVSLSQPLVISGRRGAGRAAALALQAAARHQDQLTRREVLRAVHILWAEVLYTRGSQEVAAVLLEQARETLEIARLRFEARAAPESHVTKALVEVYEVESTRRRLEAMRARVSAELEGVLGGFVVPWERIEGAFDSPHSDVASIEAGAADTASHPRILTARHQLEAARQTLRLARASRIPDLDLSMSYGVSRATDESFFEAGVAVPIPIFDRNQGGIEEGRATVTRAEHELRAAERDLQTTWAVAHASYQVILAESEAVRTLVEPAAARALDQAEEGYRAGRVPLLDLIDAQRTYGELRIRALELERDLVATEAELASLAGAGPYTPKGDLP